MLITRRYPARYRVAAPGRVNYPERPGGVPHCGRGTVSDPGRTHWLTVRVSLRLAACPIGTTGHGSSYPVRYPGTRPGSPGGRPGRAGRERSDRTVPGTLPYRTVTVY
eukprot:767377-Hanusia_phi.AAC.1